MFRSITKIYIFVLQILFTSLSCFQDEHYVFRRNAIKKLQCTYSSVRLLIMQGTCPNKNI